MTELGVNIADKTVYQLVRYQLGAKLKLPRLKSCKQHPKANYTLKKLPLALKFLQEEFGGNKGK